MISISSINVFLHQFIVLKTLMEKHWQPLMDTNSSAEESLLIVHIMYWTFKTVYYITSSIDNTLVDKFGKNFRIAFFSRTCQFLSAPVKHGLFMEGVIFPCLLLLFHTQKRQMNKTKQYCARDCLQFCKWSSYPVIAAEDNRHIISSVYKAIRIWFPGVSCKFLMEFPVPP